ELILDQVEDSVDADGRTDAVAGSHWVSKHMQGSQVRPGRIADDTKTHRVEAEPVRVRDNPVDASADIVGDTWPDALLRCGKPVVQRDSDIPKAGEELAPPPVLLLRAGLEPSSVEHEHRGVIVTVDRGID